jgi:hypothetical protein
MQIAANASNNLLVFMVIIFEVTNERLLFANSLQNWINKYMEFG